MAIIELRLGSVDRIWKVSLLERLFLILRRDCGEADARATSGGERLKYIKVKVRKGQST